MELPGEYNVYNCLAAAACGHAMGYDLKQIKTGLEKVRAVPGRYEVIPAGRDLNIIIDYAHTPDGFYNLLDTVTALPEAGLSWYSEVTAKEIIPREA